MPIFQIFYEISESLLIIDNTTLSTTNVFSGWIHKQICGNQLLVCVTLSNLKKKFKNWKFLGVKSNQSRYLGFKFCKFKTVNQKQVNKQLYTDCIILSYYIGPILGTNLCCMFTTKMLLSLKVLQSGIISPPPRLCASPCSGTNLRWCAQLGLPILISFWTEYR